MTGVPIIVPSKDAASIVKFKEREYLRPSTLFTDIGLAQEYADGRVSRGKDPIGWLVARWPAYYAAAQARSLDLSRRITVERMGETADYYIEGSGMAVRGFVRMEYLLSPVPGATKPSAPVVTVSKVAGEISHLAVSWSYPFRRRLGHHGLRRAVQENHGHHLDGLAAHRDGPDYNHYWLGGSHLPGAGQGHERAGDGIVV